MQSTTFKDAVNITHTVFRFSCISRWYEFVSIVIQHNEDYFCWLSIDP